MQGSSEFCEEKHSSVEAMWHDIVVTGDEGGESYGAAAPLIIEALQLLANTRSLSAALTAECQLLELSRAMEDRLGHRSMERELRALCELLRSCLDAVHDTFLSLGVYGGRENGSMGSQCDLLHCVEGLVFPKGLQMNSFLKADPTFCYTTFHKQFQRLCKIVSDGRLFSACELRIGVLQSCYHLFRTYNDTREENFHPTFGAGSLLHCPTVDVRHIGTCMSAKTLIEFMKRTLECEPNLSLTTRRAVNISGAKMAANSRQAQWVDDGSECRRGYVEASELCASSTNKNDDDITLKELADAFFGPTLQPHERVFTPAGLGLRSAGAESLRYIQDRREMLGEVPSELRSSLALMLQFLDVYNGDNGKLHARLIQTVLTRLCVNDRSKLELELSVSGRVEGEVEYLARWCANSGLLALDYVRLSLRIVMHPLTESSSNCTAKSMEDVLKNIFQPIWLALLRPLEYPELGQFLRHLAFVSVAVNGDADVQELPESGDPGAYSVESGVSPPDAFFIYHVWRNIQLVNCLTATHMFMRSSSEVSSAQLNSEGTDVKDHLQHICPSASSFFLHHGPSMPRPLLFRLHTSKGERNSFTEGVLGLLLADQVVNPLEVFCSSPLAYLYYLTQRSVMLTPCNTHGASHGTALKGAVPFVVETGLNAFVSTMEPLLHHVDDDALTEELNSIRRVHELSLAEVMELTLHSAECANIGMAYRCKVLGGPWCRVRAKYNDFAITQVNSLRLRFRELSLAREVDLLCRKGLSVNSRFWVGSEIPSGDAHQNELLAVTTFLRLRLKAQREAVFRFFGVPPSEEFGTQNSKACEQGNIYCEKELVKYPRIVVSGPVGNRDSHAQSLVSALRRRQYYRSFNAAYEPPYLAEGRMIVPDGKAPDAPKNSSFSPAAPASGASSKDSKGNQCEWRSESAREQSILHPNATQSFTCRFFSPSMAHENNVEVPTAFHCRNGVRDVRLPEGASKATREYFRPLPSWEEFQSDARRLRVQAVDRETVLYSKKRLEMLERKFNLHTALTNDDQEEESGGTNLLREKSDVYKCVKVDVHCHMASGMTARELLNFIQEKVRKHPNDIVGVKSASGVPVRLHELFADIRSRKLKGVVSSVEDLTIASLQVKAGKATFKRFDVFNGRYSPLGVSELRSLLLKTDNFIGGRYFAELVQKAFLRQEADGHVFSEYRLSIYGRHRDEWKRLSGWFVMHRVHHPTNRWMIQIPRVYHTYRSTGVVSSFEELLSNIFVPLWEASINPRAHPFMDYFLSHISGFDVVDNESEREMDIIIDTPPARWTSAEQPPFMYWMYYIWANVTSLNRYRAARGLCTFSLRPHAGESGDPGHMADVFLLVDGVNHGINLKHSPTLQYLYYLAQIPLGITPLSNNALFCKYEENPFPTFFRRGLNVTLSTDGPLIFHYTEQPLIEEYSTAANYWNLSQVDLCEIARNSVLMSGFPSYKKKKWLGELCVLRSAVGNDVRRSHVPQSRCSFRYETYLDEVRYLERKSGMDFQDRPFMNAINEHIYIMKELGITRREAMEQQINGQLGAKAAERTQGLIPHVRCMDGSKSVRFETSSL
ncbi:AMP deaminase [Trypanosoma vivax]|nr:AMP deaminase [Trypanosoma vivax]